MEAGLGGVGMLMFVRLVVRVWLGWFGKRVFADLSVEHCELRIGDWGFRDFGLFWS